MGYIKHHAIIVTSWSDEYIGAAHKIASEIFASQHNDFPGVTPIISSPVKGYASFMVVPDGSKEGWDASDEGDANRKKFKTFIRESIYLDWVEVAYGGDDPEDAYLPDHNQHEEVEDDE